jgi:hypothetical protein
MEASNSKAKILLFLLEPSVRQSFWSIEPHNDLNWTFLDFILNPAWATLPIQDQKYAKNHLQTEAFLMESGVMN